MRRVAFSQPILTGKTIASARVVTAIAQTPTSRGAGWLRERNYVLIELTLYNSHDHRQTLLGAGQSLRIGGESVGSTAIRTNSSELADAVLEEVIVGGRSRLLISNRGQSVVLPGGKRILAGMTRELDLPAQFWIGQTIVYAAAEDAELIHDAALVAFPRMSDDSQHFATVMKKLGSAPASHTLAYWFDALGRLQRSIAGSREFFASAAYALFDPGGLDVGMILEPFDSDWRIAASYVSHPDAAMTFRRTLLDRVVTERRTIFHDAKSIAENCESLCNGFVVASPICNDAGDVVAVAYGARFDHANNNRRGIRPLEAQFVQAVADTVAASLSRLASETKAAQSKARLELAFSPRVAQELERNPRLLEGDQREITALFCDLRGFTSLCDRLSPRESFAMLGDVMDSLTHCVTKFDGIVLDYFGDGLAAFWNAPLYQADHASLACQAGMAMLEALPDVSEDWFPVIGKHLRIGIGIHTGLAQVGNAGSRQRIKYGPRGTTLNLANRIQDATKRLGISLLISKETRQQLHLPLQARLVGHELLSGFPEPIELHQPLSPEQQTQVASHQCELDEAFKHFVADRIFEAQRIVYQLQARGVIDPALDRLVRKLRDPSHAS